MRHGNSERASDQPSKDEDPLPTSVVISPASDECTPYSDAVPIGYLPST